MSESSKQIAEVVSKGGGEEPLSSKASDDLVQPADENVPIIDLKDGQAVRLLRGEMAAATVFNDDPAAQGRAFVDAGAVWLHLVDLDGAFAGEPRNARAVEAILAACPVPVQLGGGIRDRATVERWLGAGVRRVILGTAAVEDPDFVREVARAFPGQVAVGLDALLQR